MMSAIFYFQPTLNRIFNKCLVILIQDWFFLKYERGGGSNLPPPPPATQKKLTLKSPALLRLKCWENRFHITSMSRYVSSSKKIYAFQMCRDDSRFRLMQTM